MSDLMENLGPTIVALAPSFFGGWLVGRLARRALKTTMLVASGFLLLVWIAGRLGLDAGFVKTWVDGASSWAGENIDGARRSLAALLPSATAAAVGGWLGFGRKGRRMRS
jgi:hypothetical protein